MQLLNIERTLSVMITYRCNAACEHCGTFSHPGIKGRLPIERVFAALEQASEIGFSNVVFTGGEPTIYFDDLLKCIRRAASLGFPVRLVTNGLWALRPELAKRKALALKEAGLSEINFSTGNEHVRFVPIRAVKNAIIACLELDIRPNVMIERTSEQFPERVELFDKEFVEYFPDFESSQVIDSPWMPMDSEIFFDYPEDICANRGNIHKFQGCDSVLQTYVLSTDDYIKSCCGLGSRNTPELQSLESFDGNNSKSLQNIVYEAEQDFLKLWIRNEGPEHVLMWAAEKDDGIEWEGRYAHRCQACMRVYSDRRVREAILNHYGEKIGDILARELAVERFDDLVTNRAEIAVNSASRD